MSDVKSKIREVLAARGGLPGGIESLSDQSDLYAAGLSSFASVQIMLALEEAFDLEFPDSLLNRKTFQSVDAIAAAVQGILSGAQAAE
ncbi:acyl carrier protein [Mesorhizobium sp. 1M-11]|uniref:acyl carrier protein n=1 Tax=Mesorhizobium sp. 1M-11 TaxID=1529006 RepID=UPI0006C74A03|nr:acyl carrier protein [Mesorhizobium sp. 1M-11]